MRRPGPYPLFLFVTAAALVWSAIRPKDYGVWIFELSLGLVGVAFLIATRGRYPFSGLVYGLAAIHFVILACGAKYTYAEMPLFNWLRDAFHLSRNHFDRVGHLAQGFIPAMFVRELLRWWMVVRFYPSNGPEWLGMQGDPWDAQEDMLMALIGSTVAILTLSRIHERSMATLFPGNFPLTVPSADRT